MFLVPHQNAAHEDHISVEVESNWIWRSWMIVWELSAEAYATGHLYPASVSLSCFSFSLSNILTVNSIYFNNTSMERSVAVTLNLSSLVVSFILTVVVPSCLSTYSASLLLPFTEGNKKLMSDPGGENNFQFIFLLNHFT